MTPRLDVLGTLGFGLALVSLGWQWWTRHTAPDQELRIRKAIRDAERVDQARPVSNALQFLEPLPERSALGLEPPGPLPMQFDVMLRKEANRLAQLIEVWSDVSDIVGADQAAAWSALNAMQEVDWLRSASPGTDSVVLRRLQELRYRLERLQKTLA